MMRPLENTPRKELPAKLVMVREKYTVILWRSERHLKGKKSPKLVRTEHLTMCVVPVMIRVVMQCGLNFSNRQKALRMSGSSPNIRHHIKQTYWKKFNLHQTCFQEFIKFWCYFKFE